MAGPGVTTADTVAFQDLSKAHETLDQRQTPFLSRLSAGKRPGDLIYYQALDKMGKRRKGGKPERQDIKGYEGDKSVKLGARLEYFHRDPSVSTEAEEQGQQNQAALMKNYTGQVTKKLKENKRDIDFAMLSDQESQEDDGIKGYFFRGAGRWINDGVTGAATSQGGDSPSSYTGGVADLAFNDTAAAIPQGLRTPAAQIYAGVTADFLEANVNAMMQTRGMYSGATEDFTLWVGYALKSQITNNWGRYVADKAGFVAVSRGGVAVAENRKLVTSGIDIFEGDFGNLTVEIEPWMPTNARGYGMEMSRVEKRQWFVARHRELENKGGGRRGLIESIIGPWFDDPRAHFKVCPSDEVAAVVNYDF
jgi:hypothetical protein